MKGVIKENLIVMLMPSHSHRVTFGHIDLHLPVFLQAKTVLNRMYVSIQDTVVHEQANRRPAVIQQVVYKNKEKDRSLN